MQKKKKIRPIWYNKEGLGGAAVNNYRLATNTVSLAYFRDKIGHMINGGCLVCGSLFAMQRTPVQCTSPSYVSPLKVTRLDIDTDGRWTELYERGLEAVSGAGESDESWTPHVDTEAITGRNKSCSNLVARDATPDTRRSLLTVGGPSCLMQGTDRTEPITPSTPLLCLLKQPIVMSP